MTPISKELLKQIEDEAETYSFVLPYDNSVSFYDHPKRNAYIAGATAYAHYKELWEQAKNALEQIANAPTPYNLEEMWSWIHTARNLSDTALSSWKEEGKDNQCTMCNNKAKSNGLLVCSDCYKSFDGDRRSLQDPESYH